MNNEPVAWMQVHHEDGKPTKFSKVQTWEDDIPLYTHSADESFDRTASHMAGEYVSYPAKTLTDEEDTECQFCKQGCIRCDARKLLTDEEIRQIAVECGVYINEQGSIYPDDICIYSFARAILRKAKQK